MSDDPLSFFAGEDSSSSESEEENKQNSDSEDVTVEAAPSNPNKLPPPDNLFATVKKPSFLTDPSKKHINWDHFVKNDADDADANSHLGEGGGNYAAIAPPKEMGDDSKHSRKVHSSLSAAIISTYSNTGGEISAPPVRYTTNEVDAKFRTVSDGGGNGSSSELPQDTGSKRLSSNPTEEGESKKQKVESFRQKEKRKRDLGQTSRGKSYVEEEKRVLRQHFATDEVMN